MDNVVDPHSTPGVPVVWHIEYFIIVNSHCSQFKIHTKKNSLSIFLVFSKQRVPSKTFTCILYFQNVFGCLPGLKHACQENLPPDLDNVHHGKWYTKQKSKINDISNTVYDYYIKTWMYLYIFSPDI